MFFEVDAVLFDNDGVLVDSHHHVSAAWSQLATAFDLDITKLLSELVGVRAIDTLRRHLPSERCAVAVAHLEEIEVGLASSTVALPGAVELINQLQGHRWTIATSASRRLAQARWAGAGIPQPKLTITADDVSEGKPNPEPFLAAARLLRVEPSRCLIFEDSPAGGEAARAAGAIVVAVGDQPWDVAPAARVASLASVIAGPSADDTQIQIDLITTSSRSR